MCVAVSFSRMPNSLTQVPSVEIEAYRSHVQEVEHETMTACLIRVDI